MASPSSKPDIEANQNQTQPTTWNGPNDPDHPQNWPRGLKWKNTCTVSLFVFISPISSSMIAPAMANLGESLHMNSQIEIYLSMAIFILAYAIGPIFFGPASELYGRVRLLQASNAWYLLWNLACGFAHTKGQFFAFRFLAGIGGSAPLAIGGGAIGDMWSAEERGKAMGVYTLGPLLGPVVGPVAGGFIAEYATWRWVFWATSAVALAVQGVGFVWLRESHPGTLLRRRRDRFRKDIGDQGLYTDTDADGESEALGGKLLFGITYLMFATFPEIWTQVYKQSPSIGGLHYLSIAIGSFLGLFLNLKFIDRIYKTLKARNDNISIPEFRMPSLAIGSVISTVGLFCYAWSIGNTHWIGPDIGAAIFAAGTISCLQGMQMYIVDSYQTYAASALAACAILRSLAGFGFPLFAPYMYRALGYNWGTSVLAFVTIGIGWTAPVGFWVFGGSLRARSVFAAG